VKIHDKGDRRLDGILRLIEEAGRPLPIDDVLATLVREIAAIARTEVVSVYVREKDDLVMRANVGLSASAVGVVRLRMGEGITGFVAECLRPVSCASARDEAHYKHVPGIGEEHFPSFLALPLLGGAGAGAAGVLVLQRRAAKAFPPAEVALAMALAAPVAYALERARERGAERVGVAALPSRAARLEGVAVAPGAVLGRVEALPSLDGAMTGTGVDAAFTHVARELDREQKKLEPVMGGKLRPLVLLLEDRRLRELMIDECATHGLGQGLGHVVREYARAPYRTGAAGDGEGGAWLAERADDIEDLCALVAARAAGHRVMNAGAVIVAERLTSVAALAAASRKCAAFAIGSPVDGGGLAAGIARAASLPIIGEIASLFVWTRPGDRVLCDGDSGVLRVNPPATAIARLRASRTR
jgi:phosphotransferase system enzyme I (PtsP)